MSAWLLLGAFALRLVTAPAADRAWEGGRRRARTVAEAAQGSYYGIPPIHKPQWRGLIVGYFFLGGLAGASYLLAAIADLVGGRDGRPIARLGRYLALAALLPCPVLLTLDLGRPWRFHHMLRVLKLRSPMSLGTWGLVAFSGFCGLSALIEAARDGWLGRGGRARLLARLPARALAAVGVLPAFFLGGYTGVLLGATAVPLWARSHWLLGPLFLASAVSSASAALALLLALGRRTSERALARLERLDSLALAAEGGLLLALRANLDGPLARPLDEGRLGRVHRLGVLGLGTLAPLALYAPSALLGRAPRRPVTMLAATLALVGGVLLRYLVLMAGLASADDPAATWHLSCSTGAQAVSAPN